MGGGVGEMGDTQTMKATRFGDDWELRWLGDHLKFLRHGTNPRSDLTTDGSVRYLHYGDIHTSADPYLDPDARPMPTLTIEQASLLDPLDDGDLVFVDASEDLSGVGKSVELKGLRGRPVVAGLHTIAVRFNKSVLADGFKAYLQFHPAFCRHLRRLAAGTKVYATNRTHIASARLPLPPLPEQRAIAAVLCDVDELIGSLEALIAKKRAIKQAAMQELLTGRTRLPGFGGEWEEGSLVLIAQLHREHVVPDPANETPYMHFSLPAYDAGRRPVMERGEVIRSGKFRVRSDSILVSRLNPRIPRVWAPTHIGPNAVASTEFLVMTPKASTVRAFLYYLCSSRAFSERMVLAVTGTTGSHQRVNRADAMQLVVRFPKDLPEQRAIATILSDMDAAIAALEHRLDKTRAIKQGMMQQLLTGSIRLPIPDDDKEDDDAHDA